MSASSVKIVEVTETPQWVEVKPGGGGAHGNYCVYYIYTEAKDGDYYIRSDDAEAMKSRNNILDAVANKTKLKIEYVDDTIENETISRSLRYDKTYPFTSLKLSKHRKITSAKP